MISAGTFKGRLDIEITFPNEQTCIDHLEYLRWGDKVTSPYDPQSQVYACKGNKYKCKNSGKYFTVKTGTLFANTKISLRNWFLAIYFETSYPEGISSVQLSNELGITQKSAWFMLQRIRACFDPQKET